MQLFRPSKAPHDCSTDQESQLSREHVHAMKNIFSIIRANVEMIEEETAPVDAVQRRLVRIIAACDRAEELVEQLRAASPQEDRGQFANTAAVPAQPTPSLRGRILVVDDEPDVLKVIEHYLKDQQLSVHGVTSGVAAMEHLQHHAEHYDLLLTDMEMPYCNGLDLCRFLQEQQSQLPVVVMTGYGPSLTDSELSQTQVRAIVPKPIDRQLLVATLSQFLADS